MGRKAWEELRAQGIEMIVTDETEVEVALRMYLADELEDRTDKLH
jgi:predicted Fe-Mo cluster-binding NifX family protein